MGFWDDLLKGVGGIGMLGAGIATGNPALAIGGSEDLAGLATSDGSDPTQQKSPPPLDTGQSSDPTDTSGNTSDLQGIAARLNKPMGGDTSDSGFNPSSYSPNSGTGYALGGVPGDTGANNTALPDMGGPAPTASASGMPDLYDSSGLGLGTRQGPALDTSSLNLGSGDTSGLEGAVTGGSGGGSTGGWGPGGVTINTSSGTQDPLGGWGALGAQGLGTLLNIIGGAQNRSLQQQAMRDANMRALLGAISQNVRP